MQIFILHITGRKFQYDVEPSDKVLSVKEKVQEKEGIQADQIRIIYKGRQLADDKDLQHYDVKAGDALNVVMQLRGGY